MRLALTFVFVAVVCSAPAASARGVRPQAVSKESRPIEFVDITNQSGIKWGAKQLAPGLRYLIETMGGGGGFLDYNNDGLLDIYLVSYTQPAAPDARTSPRDALYRNNGDGTFADVTATAGIDNRLAGMGLASADYNNDGYADIYVTGYGASRLYRNNRDGTFSDVTEKAGINNRLWGAGAAFFDADSDGHLDLFVCNYLDFDPAGKVPCDFFEGRPYCYISKFKGQPPVLYRNNRDGTFTDVSARAGVAGHRAKGLGVVTFDYDGDGRADIFQANDSDPNFLFRNNGDWTFSEVALEAECALDPNGAVRGGMGVDAEDVDGDGHLDVFVTNFSQQTNAFWHNNGDGTFTETTYEMGLGKVSLPMSGFGTRFFDYNNDGLVDLFVLNGHPFEPIQKVFPETTYAEPPFLFENTGRAMRDVAADRGAALKRHYLGRGLAVGDIDNDGDSDLLLMNAGEPPMLLRNDGGNRNNWLGLRLVGSKSNRNALGARVTVRVGASRRVKQALGGASYLSASDTRLLYGLGSATKVDEVEVRWPSGTVTKLKDVGTNRYITVREEETAPVKR